MWLVYLVYLVFISTCMPVLPWHCGSFENKNTLVFSSSQSLIGIFRSLHHKPARAVGVNVVSQVCVSSLCFRLRVSSPLTLRIELGRGQFFSGQVLLLCLFGNKDPFVSLLRV